MNDAAAITETFKVFSVDTTTSLLVLEKKDGTLRSVEVLRPEFQEKLKDLKAGDQIDATYSEAAVTAIAPMAPGDEAKLVMKVGTLVIDRGEIVKRSNNVLMIRNEKGRMLRVTVPGDFRFNIDGKELRVDELKDGTKLMRTAIRVNEVSFSD